MKLYGIISVEGKNMNELGDFLYDDLNRAKNEAKRHLTAHKNKDGVFVIGICHVPESYGIEKLPNTINYVVRNEKIKILKRQEIIDMMEHITLYDTFDGIEMGHPVPFSMFKEIEQNNMEGIANVLSLIFQHVTDSESMLGLRRGLTPSVMITSEYEPKHQAGDIVKINEMTPRYMLLGYVYTHPNWFTQAEHDLPNYPYAVIHDVTDDGEYILQSKGSKTMYANDLIVTGMKETAPVVPFDTLAEIKSWYMMQAKNESRNTYVREVGYRLINKLEKIEPFFRMTEYEAVRAGDDPDTALLKMIQSSDEVLDFTPFLNVVRPDDAIVLCDKRDDIDIRVNEPMCLTNCIGEIENRFNRTDNYLEHTVSTLYIDEIPFQVKIADRIEKGHIYRVQLTTDVTQYKRGADEGDILNGNGKPLSIDTDIQTLDYANSMEAAQVLAEWKHRQG